MTRRVMKPQPVGNLHKGYYSDMPNTWVDDVGYPHKPRFSVGDILWVRETWTRYYCGGGCEGDGNGACIENRTVIADGCYLYRATHFLTGDGRWRPSIFMPKSAARIFLRVTDVRLERVQGISPQDAHKEGIDFRPFNGDYPHYQDWLIKDFKELWDKINAKRGYGWEKNPWVWVYTYERVDKPEGWPLCA